MLKALAKLLESRKNKIGLITWLTASIIWAGGRYGLELPAELVGPLAAALVTLGVVIIGAIAHEDAAAKSAGMAPIAAPNNLAAVRSIAPPSNTNVQVVENPPAEAASSR